MEKKLNIYIKNKSWFNYQKQLLTHCSLLIKLSCSRAAHMAVVKAAEDKTK